MTRRTIIWYLAAITGWSLLVGLGSYHIKSAGKGTAVARPQQQAPAAPQPQTVQQQVIQQQVVQQQVVQQQSAPKQEPQPTSHSGTTQADTKKEKQ